MAEEIEEIPYPCPACGSTLYGWTAAHDPLDRGKRTVLDRCESCGLCVTRARRAPEPGPELDAVLTPEGSGHRLVAGNRQSWQGGIGGAQWAGLEPELRRLHLNPEGTRRLLAQRRLELGAVRTPFSSRSYKGMLQTLVNAFTLRDNFFRNARAGRIPRETTTDKLAYALDWVVSALVVIPMAIIALPLELLATPLKKGGVMVADVTPASGERKPSSAGAGPDAVQLSASD